MFNLRGMYAPIATPFENDEIAYDRLEENMNFWLNSKLSGFMVMGSNGEFVVMKPEEKKELIRAVCEMSKGKKPVIAGTACESTRDTIELTEFAAKVGADAAIMINPNYYKRALSDEVIKTYYIDVANASPIPVLLYNNPANTGINLSSKLVADLSYHPNIIGIKDAGGNIVQIAEIINNSDPNFVVHAGSANFLYPSYVLGAVGGTCALANILPDECAEIQELVDANKHNEARLLQLRLLEINHSVTARWGISGLKAAMEMLGLFGGIPRRPLLPLSDQDKKLLRDILEKAKKPA
ncbi:MAG: dihydrodipicolinate synthase family protein [Peptococcaceae bacterium]|nr:dihydrodipicolinate synthase family protein [Peptococcaceae bacterium]